MIVVLHLLLTLVLQLLPKRIDPCHVTVIKASMIAVRLLSQTRVLQQLQRQTGRIVVMMGLAVMTTVALLLLPIHDLLQLQQWPKKTTAVSARKETNGLEGGTTTPEVRHQFSRTRASLMLLLLILITWIGRLENVKMTVATIDSVAVTSMMTAEVEDLEETVDTAVAVVEEAFQSKIFQEDLLLVTMINTTIVVHLGKKRKSLLWLTY
mmetsp:Transcript_24955/g.59313  ORF Transcript_24955/g.59313 Transcript_24955/m.59313 type:complete len:209 (+) Transcript_24955:646-1272(+)